MPVILIVATIGTGPRGERRERDETSVTVSPATSPIGRACATSRTRPFVFSRPTTIAGVACRPRLTQTRPFAIGETDATPGTAASFPAIRSASWNSPRPAGVTRRCGVSARRRFLMFVWKPERSASETTSAATPSSSPRNAASATTPTCASRRDARR